MATTVPNSHADLLQDPIVVTFVTVMPDGQPQATAAWCHYSNGAIHILTRTTTRKYKNLVRHPAVTVLAIDPKNTSRYVEVRGNARVTRDGANDLLRVVATAYGRPDYPIADGAEHRVIITVTPERVITRG